MNQHSHEGINAALLEIKSAIGRLEGTTRANHEAEMQRLNSINGSVADHEKRLARGESVHRFWGWLGGVLLVAVGIAGVVVKVVIG